MKKSKFTEEQITFALRQADRLTLPEAEFRIMPTPEA
jgi:hypothetical protein